MDNKKITDEARAKISELSKKQDEIYSSLIFELKAKEDSLLSDYLFDYCFNDCDFDFDILDEND